MQPDAAQDPWLAGEDLPRARFGLLFALVLCLALGLRLDGTSWGLPYQLYPDEPQHIKSVFFMLKDRTLDHGNWTYPSHFPIAMMVAGWLSAPGEPAWEKIPQYLLAGRILSNLCGTLMVALTVLWTRRLLGSSWLGLLAGLFLAVTPIMVRENQLAVVDSLGALWTLVTGFAGYVALEKRSLRWLAVSGAASGLAAAAKYNLGVVALWPALVAFQLGDDLSRRLRLLVLAAGFSISGLLVGCPMLPVRLDRFHESLAAESKHYAVGHWVQSADRFTWHRYSAMLRDQLGWLGIGMVLLGVSRVRRVPHGLYLVSFPLAYFLFMGSFRVDFQRAMLPVLPAHAFLAALGVGIVAQAVWRRRAGSMSLLIPVVMVATACGQVMRERETLAATERASHEAMEWAVTNIPPGTRIAAEWFGPPFNQWPSPVKYAVEIQPLAVTRGLEALRQAGFGYVVESGMYELLVENPAAYDPSDRRYGIREQHELLRSLHQPVAAFGHIRYYKLGSGSAGEAPR